MTNVTNNNVATQFLDFNEKVSSAFADWSAFAQHMPAYTNNRTGAEQTVFEGRLGYPVDRMCTFWWQQTYGNTATPGQADGSQNAEYAPFTRYQKAEARLVEVIKKLSDAGLSDMQMEQDFEFVNARVQAHSEQLWLDYCRTNLAMWMRMYVELNNSEFTYQPYQEAPKVVKQAASSTRALLAMIPKHTS